MGKTDKEVLELCKSWFEDIMERSDKLTSGNVSHGSRAIHGVAKNYAEYIDEHLHNRWKPNDLPHWKKSTLPNDNTTGFNSDYFCYKGYYINYKELFEKLPKDD